MKKWKMDDLPPGVGNILVIGGMVSPMISVPATVIGFYKDCWWGAITAVIIQAIWWFGMWMVDDF